MNLFSAASAALAIILIWVCTLGCGEKTATAPAGGSAVGTQEGTVARVVAAKPERKTIRRTLTQPGQIEAFYQARLHAKIPAYVERYLVDIGDQVTGPKYDSDGKLTAHGQLLAELSAPELDQEVAQKKALVAQASADVEQSQAAIKVAEAEATSAEAMLTETRAAVSRVEADYQRWHSEFARIEQLVAKSAVTQKLADETKNQLLSADAARQEMAAKVESARARLAASRAQVDQKLADESAVRSRRAVAEADHARALALVNYLRIEAPFDGTVSQRGADIGYFAQSGGGNATQPLFTIVQMDRVRVFIDLPEMDAPLANAGDKARVRVQALSGREFLGAVTRTSWALDPTSRTLHTEVDVPNENGELRPGMYAQVSIDLAEQENAIVVPTAAVVSQDGATWCYVVEENKAVRKAVSLGIKSGQEVAIKEGLNDDELVVQSKAASLSDGAAVEVIEAAPLAK